MERINRKKIFTYREKATNSKGSLNSDQLKEINDFIITKINRKISPLFKRNKRKQIFDECLSEEKQEELIHLQRIKKKRKLSQRLGYFTERKRIEEDESSKKYEQLQQKAKNHIFSQQVLYKPKKKTEDFKKISGKHEKILIQTYNENETNSSSCSYLGTYFQKLKYRMQEKLKKRKLKKHEARIVTKNGKENRFSNDRDTLNQEIDEGVMEYFFHPNRMRIRQTLCKKMLKKQ